MVSKAWKELEKYVAERLGGERLIKISYSDSQPDVIVKDVRSALGVICTQKQIALVVECKYSIDQAWQRKIVELLAKQPKGRLPLVVGENIAFWDIEDTHKILENSLDKTSWEIGESFRYHLTDLLITKTDRKIPQYIRAILGQAACYSDWVSEADKYIPMACLGQKSSKKRIMLANIEDLTGIDLQ